ncbi:unnamed protein product [Brachionus calyciflorus]|uniref:Integrase catalytic domain-containing protein n=1 Tax=Brachionus calyciflorus TaxID=104777 RepID=A0A814FIT6_9BILA|nr:unnamed protein product [Brachionus calyciflorus]
MRFQYVVPNAERPEVLEKIHDDPFSGYLGIDKTFEKLTTRFSWPNYSKDATSYVTACEVCAAVKASKAYTHIKRLRTSAYHPQCDGETEPFNRTLEQMLACYVADNHKEWDKYLPKLAFAYNTAVHATLCIVYGRQPKLPINLLFPTPNLDFNLTADAYASKVHTHLLKCYNLVEKHSQSKVNKFKFYADKHVRPASYVTDERVWLLNERKKKGISKKLSRKWSGPYTIIVKLNENKYKLRPDKPGKKKLVHVNRLKKCNSPPPNVRYDSILEITKNSLEDQLSKESTRKGINQPRETMGSQTTTPIVSTAYQPETDKGNNDGTFWIDNDHLTLQSQEVFSSP